MPMQSAPSSQARQRSRLLRQGRWRADPLPDRTQLGLAVVVVRQLPQRGGNLLDGDAVEVQVHLGRWLDRRAADPVR